MLAPISESELQIMHFLWSEMEEGRLQQSFADILEHTQGLENKVWKKQTVNTFLCRLRQKGFIDVIPTMRYSLYQPIVTRTEYLNQFLESILPDGKKNWRYGRLILGLLKENPNAREKNSLLKIAEHL